jgi:hypothetical protein
MKKGWSCGQHSQKSALKNGLDPLSYSKDPKDDDSDDDDKKPAAVEKTYINITQEMKTKTAELATSKLTTTPESIWGDVVSWANCTYDGLWYRIKEQQVKDLVRKSRKKLGFGNAISTIENTHDYNKMTDQDRPFLHCSACFPHPEKPDTNMRMMIFANPYLLGLLTGLVDIFIDATFSPCTPNPFYQCLIIMVYDSQTRCIHPSHLRINDSQGNRTLRTCVLPDQYANARENESQDLHK